MDDPLSIAVRIIASLNQEQVVYVVVGGVAMNVHGILRATEDLDLFVQPTPENIERLRRALHSVWDDDSIDQISADDLCGDYPAVRYGPPTGHMYLDIVTRFGEAVSFGDLEVEEVTIDGVPIRVATPRTLFLMKKDTVRPMDHADAAALAEAFAFGDDES